MKVFSVLAFLRSSTVTTLEMSAMMPSSLKIWWRQVLSNFYFCKTLYYNQIKTFFMKVMLHAKLKIWSLIAMARTIWGLLLVSFHPRNVLSWSIYNCTVIYCTALYWTRVLLQKLCLSFMELDSISRNLWEAIKEF